MTKGPLERLTIAHLRGAVNPFELTFERGKKLTIIYGENGNRAVTGRTPARPAACIHSSSRRKTSRI
ncbi:MAG: hypothetical protein EOM24_06445 [Chloroflexia bacterium]|nr:hypothetical protein [Chloroflexia bacterium]